VTSLKYGQFILMLSLTETYYSKPKIYHDAHVSHRHIPACV